MVRNRLRHDLIPEIEKLMGRPVKQALLRTIELAAREGEFLRSLVPEMQNQAELDAAELRKLPVAIQRRTIHGWLRHQKIKDCGFDEIEAVRSLVDRSADRQNQSARGRLLPTASRPPISPVSKRLRSAKPSVRLVSETRFSSYE